MFGGTRRGRLTALTPVLVVVLAGCTGDPEPIEPTGSPPGTPSPTVPAEGPPPMPTPATEDTEAGAIAFVEHYIEVFNYAANTGDVEPLRALSHPDCEGCETYASMFEEQYETGGYNEGFEWLVMDPRAYEKVVEVDIEISEYRYRDSEDGDELQAEGSSTPLGFELSATEPLVVEIFLLAP